MVSALEKGEEQMISLQQSCSSLREQIEDKEDKLKEVRKKVTHAVNIFKKNNRSDVSDSEVLW